VFFSREVSYGEPSTIGEFFWKIPFACPQPLYFTETGLNFQLFSVKLDFLAWVRYFSRESQVYTFVGEYLEGDLSSFFR
jgi:hypothetical protein